MSLPIEQLSSVEKAKVVIANLNLLKANRVLIANMFDEFTSTGNPYVNIDGLYSNSDNRRSEFEYTNGVCGNANIWLLDYSDDRYSYATINGNNYSTIMDYLGQKFVTINNFTKNDFIYPVPTLKDVPRWSNKHRWEYVDFCLDELAFFVEHEQLKGI